MCQKTDEVEDTGREAQSSKKTHDKQSSVKLPIVLRGTRGIVSAGVVRLWGVRL